METSRDDQGRFAPGSPRLPGSGRQKGSSNKLTRDLREMIETALSEVGGVEYLQACAQHTDSRVRCAFLALVSKCIPRDIRADVRAGKEEVVINVITGIRAGPPASGASEDGVATRNLAT